jgi:hypothetical protein
MRIVVRRFLIVVLTPTEDEKFANQPRSTRQPNDNIRFQADDNRSHPSMSERWTFFCCRPVNSER